MATILHADLDAFYASVEQRDNHRLVGIPMAVGGGVILAASYEARAFGVRTAMSESEARRRCPQLVTVSPRMEAYSQASNDVFDIFHDTTPLVEGLSIDEAFLDVGGLTRLVGPARPIAIELRARVASEVGLNLSVGIASTKFLAKVASAVCKPDGLLEVVPGHELNFLHPLPVERLWGVGPKTTDRLHARGLRTVAQVAALDLATLTTLLGKGTGNHLHALANNLDPRPIQVGKRRGSVGSQRSFPRSALSAAASDAILLDIADRIARRLRQGGRVGRTVVLRMRFGDFTQATRSHTLPEATASTDDILATARQLLRQAWPLIEARGLTRLGLSVANLCNDDAIQLTLPFGGIDRAGLDQALDTVRDRFGTSSIGRTTLVRPRHSRPAAPQSPPLTNPNQ